MRFAKERERERKSERERKLFFTREKRGGVWYLVLIEFDDLCDKL